jgi:hypothetical protein
MELRPAHEAMLNQIKHHCSELEKLNKIIAEGAPTHTGSETRIPPGSFEMGRTLEIGGLCSLLETLEKAIIPADKLDEVIAGLAEIEYHHVAIWGIIRALRERKT